MLCPYCLSDVEFEYSEGAAPRVSDTTTPASAVTAKKPRGPNLNLRYRCPLPECRQTIPTMYVQDYNAYPPVVTSAVGFPGHGKTVYFASLFHSLRDRHLADKWPGFFSVALDDDSLKTVHHNMAMLDKGDLPEATPQNFPRPTLLRLERLPGVRNATLCLYDTSGEAFEEAIRVQRYARFVARAHTVLFLISIPHWIAEQANFGMGMDALLNSYLIGLRELGGDPKNQDLVTVYTKADVLTTHLSGWKNLYGYVTSDSFAGLNNMTQYLSIMDQISDNLAKFTEQGLRAPNYLNTARGKFRSARFCLISSLGAAPNASSNKMEVQIAPCRVLDPLLLLLHHRRPIEPAGLPGQPGFLRRLFGP